MIVGVYGKDGSALVGPLDKIAARVGKSEYEIKQLLEGKHEWPGFVVVKLPPNSVHRY